MLSSCDRLFDLQAQQGPGRRYDRLGGVRIPDTRRVNQFDRALSGESLGPILAAPDHIGGTERRDHVIKHVRAKVAQYRSGSSFAKHCPDCFDRHSIAGKLAYFTYI